MLLNELFSRTLLARVFAVLWPGLLAWELILVVLLPGLLVVLLRLHGIFHLGSGVLAAFQLTELAVFFLVACRLPLPNSCACLLVPPACMPLRGERRAVLVSLSVKYRGWAQEGLMDLHAIRALVWARL